MVVGRNMPTTMGKSLISKIFIKSAVDLKKLKLSVMIVWGRIQFFGPCFAKGL